jgi:membrane fusion protein (multidrug efflux system)
MTQQFDIPATQTFEHPERIKKPLRDTLRPWL